MNFRSGAITAGIIAAFLLPGISSATTLYRYTYYGGPEYELITPGIPEDVGQMTGYFDFLAPLESGWHQNLSPISFYFTDGFTSINENSGYDLSWIEAHVGDGGEIDYAWFQIVYSFSEPADPYRHIMFMSNFYDEQTIYCSAICTAADWEFENEIAYTTNFAKAGIAAPYWTTSVVPVPAAVWLFTSGLGLLGWMKRSRANL